MSALGGQFETILLGNTMITERQKNILINLIGDYVKNAEPIASADLTKKFKLSSATMRNELALLEEAGYLHQPHTSAGRIPTDKGYRFYINELEQKPKIESKTEKHIQKEMADYSQNLEKLFSYLLREMAKATDNLAIARFLESGNVVDWGLERMLKAPEFENREDFLEAVEHVGELREELEDLFDEATGRTVVFVGRENPIKGFDEYSLIVSGISSGGQKVVYGLFGPKRMQYDKNTALVQYINNLISEEI